MKLIIALFLSCVIFITSCITDSSGKALSENSEMEMAGIPTGRAFLRPRTVSNEQYRDLDPTPSFSSDSETQDSGSKLKLRAVPAGMDRNGRWFFDWFWGYDEPQTYPPPMLPPLPPRPGPVYPHAPYVPEIPLEVCTEMHHPITMDIYEECYPLE